MIEPFRASAQRQPVVPTVAAAPSTGSAVAWELALASELHAPNSANDQAPGTEIAPRGAPPRRTAAPWTGPDYATPPALSSALQAPSSEAIDPAASTAIAEVVEAVLGGRLDQAFYRTDGVRLLLTEDGSRVLDRRKHDQRLAGPGMDPQTRRLASVVSSYADQIASARSPEERAYELEQLAHALRRVTGDLPALTVEERRALVDARLRFRTA